jgi:hypothetical protein
MTVHTAKSEVSARDFMCALKVFDEEDRFINSTIISTADWSSKGRLVLDAFIKDMAIELLPSKLSK